MTDVTISLSERQMEELRQLSERLGVTTEELIRLGVEEMLTGLDDDIAGHVDRLLKKNKQLYDRLAG